MSDLLKQLSEPLKASEIDFRIQSINKGGYATILAYKDARVDINRLNAVVGPLGWMRSHSRDNHNCVVSLWNNEIKQWVSKEDTGTESMTEKEKGLASDSFKRACFNWGIGIELYDYPVIQVKLKDSEFDNSGQRPKQTWNLKLREWQWRVDVIDRKVTYIAAKDQNNEFRFSWGQAALKSVIENKKSIDFINLALSEDRISEAAEAWFEMSPTARKNLYVAEKHGGPFTSQDRNLMKEQFQQYYSGGDWNEGLFSEVSHE